MKRLLPLLLFAVGTLFASSAYSQVRFRGDIRLPLPPIPHVRIYAPAPPIVYQQTYPQAYYGGYAPGVVVTGPAYGYGYGYGYNKFPVRSYGYRRENFRGHEGRGWRR
jgi:hypothetical protein